LETEQIAMALCEANRARALIEYSEPLQKMGGLRHVTLTVDEIDRMCSM
jgi:hypothetical protein